MRDSRRSGLKLIGVLGLVLCWASLVLAGPWKLALLAPHGEADLFWEQFERAARVACADLDCRLDVFHARDSRPRMREQMQRVLESGYDGVLVQNFKRLGRDLVSMANRARVPVLVVNADVDEAGTERPDEVLAHWLGSLVPDDVQAGFALASELVDRGRELWPDEFPLIMVGLDGIPADRSARDRLRGLRQALAMRAEPEVMLVREVNANWQRELARQKMQVLYRLHPQLRLVWAANDAMALGAADALEAQGLEPGVDVLIGGIDWTPAGMRALAAERLAVNCGGHFLEGAWAVLILVRHLEGRLPQEHRRTWTTALQCAGPEGADAVLELLEADWDDADFGALNASSARIRTDWFGVEAFARMLEEAP